MSELSDLYLYMLYIENNSVWFIFEFIFRGKTETSERHPRSQNHVTNNGRVKCHFGLASELNLRVSDHEMRNVNKKEILVCIR